MPLPVFTHPSCVLHNPGPDHPEAPARLREVLARFRAEPRLDVRDAAPAPLEPILRVHPREYLAGLEALSASGGGRLFLDTEMSRESWDAALGAAVAVLAALDVALGSGGNAFAAIRPPGHHALASTGMGFCLLNNVVISAHAARAAIPNRVLIIDWNV